jgi:tripartite-type tricarboxylate transporter receptor subunit TctC
VNETGLPGFEADNWNAMLAPRGTPPKVVNRLGTELRQILSLSEVKTLLIQTGAEPAYGTAQSLSDRIASETVKWGKVARAAGVKPE